MTTPTITPAVDDLFEAHTAIDRLAGQNMDAFNQVYGDLRRVAEHNGLDLQALAARLGIDTAHTQAAYAGQIDLSQSDLEQLAVAAGARIMVRAFVPGQNLPAGMAEPDATGSLAMVSHIEELLYTQMWAAHHRGDHEEERRWFGALCRCDDVRVVLGD